MSASPISPTPTTPEPAAGIAGQVYHELIRAQLRSAADTKESLERRGQGVVTSSGAVLAVILAAATFATQREGVSEDTFYIAAVAMISFVAAILCGLVVNFPLGYADVAPSELRRLAETEGFWTGPFEIGMRRVATVEVDAIESAAKANGKKAGWLRAGIAIEAFAFIALGVAGALVLYPLP